MKILKVSRVWELEDVDPKGYLLFRAVKDNEYDISPKKDPVTSIRLKVSKEDWQRFKQILKQQGLNVCHAFSNFVQLVLKHPRLAHGEVELKIINIYQGKPRSKYSKKLATL